ncbi:hypothetical protein [Erythrobacter sp. MTPC3]|uniref:hypothetical protein n=1 Tax=Erythrobacter sp. MTPC3 TaxID=3056564 RepID=UPI0036F371DC
MRTTFKPIVTMMTAVTAASFTLAACTAETEEGAAAPEAGIEAPADGADLTGAEISEAVPGVEAAAPEGETGTTADLNEAEGNIVYTEDADPDREAQPGD